MKDILNYSHFVFDSREVKKGTVFIALTTGTRDGNNFAKIAFQQGAEFLILSREPEFSISKESYIVVPDTLSFIANLAQLKFSKMKQGGVKTISLTGSIGKTTTKDFIIYLLKQANKKVFGTEGNFNNQIGLPITILNAPFDLDFLVLEMGMNTPKEISNLVKIANTDLRIITNVSPAHIGNFKEGFYGIFKAKKEILENSTKETILVTIPSLAFLEEVKRDFNGKIFLTPSIENYFIKNSKTHFSIYGRSFYINKIATQDWLSLIVIGFEALKAFNLEIPQDISSFSIPSGRGDETMLSEACLLIDESYNASPSAMINAIKTLSLYEGKKLAVIGSMRELGNFEKEEHEKIVNFANLFEDIDKIFVGKEFEFINGKWFSSSDELIANFSTEEFAKYNTILVKASNSVNLGSFCKHLKNHFLLPEAKLI